MKSLRWLPALCFAASFVQADVVVEQKIESTMMNGVMTMKVKGDQARVETPSPMGGQAIVILNMGTGKMVTLMPTQKMAMEMDLTMLKKQAEAAQKATGLDAAAVKPVPTGQKMKIGEWDAEEYTVTAGGMAMHLWVAPKFPNAAALKAELAKMSKSMSSGMPDPNSFDVPGMVVKMDVDSPVGKISTTLQSAKQAPVDPSEFVVPQGYNLVKPPAGMGLGQ